MERTTHTPGPWTVGSSGVGARDHAICQGASVIAEVLGNGYPIGKGWAPSSAADARLIAAAPEMLDALRALVADVDQGSLDIAHMDRHATEGDLNKARAVITKATGA